LFWLVKHSRGGYLAPSIVVIIIMTYCLHFCSYFNSYFRLDLDFNNNSKVWLHAFKSHWIFFFLNRGFDIIFAISSYKTLIWIKFVLSPFVLSLNTLILHPKTWFNCGEYTPLWIWSKALAYAFVHTNGALDFYGFI